MVTNHHLSILLGIVIFTIIAMPVQATLNLEISVSEQQIELGKPIELQLSSPQVSVSLNQIDLSVLKKDFHIKRLSDISIIDHKQRQRVTLYPRKTGELIIPEFYFSNTRTIPIPITVISAIDPKDNSQIEVKYSISSLNPWKKQQVLVIMDLISRSSILRLNTPEGYSEHSDIISLAHSSKTLTRQNNEHTKHSSGWAVFPKQTGDKQIELPGIQLIRDGVTTHQFYPPLLELDVKPLPVYIPSTMPVGKLEVTGFNNPNPVTLTNNIYGISVTLNAHGVIPSGLPSIASQFKSNEAISYYPATLIKDSKQDIHGLTTQHHYTLNFKTLQQGINPLATFSLNYFDPDTGTIRTLQFNIKSTFSLKTMTAILLLIVILFVSYIVIINATRHLSSQWRCFIEYKKTLNSLPNIQTAVEIKNTLTKIALAENWHHNLTLQQWEQQWLNKTRKPFPVDVNDLELMLYAGKDGDITHHKQGIQQMCLQRWLPLKFIK